MILAISDRAGGASAHLEVAAVAAGGDENHGVAVLGEIGDDLVDHRLQVAAGGGVPVAALDCGLDFVGEAVDFGLVVGGGGSSGGMAEAAACCFLSSSLLGRDMMFLSEVGWRDISRFFQ